MQRCTHTHGDCISVSALCNITQPSPGTPLGDPIEVGAAAAVYTAARFARHSNNSNSGGGGQSLEPAPFVWASLKARTIALFCTTHACMHARTHARTHEQPITWRKVWRTAVIH
eukprot:359616-Chlamydomonas_euryale.AAC.2